MDALPWSPLQDLINDRLRKGDAVGMVGILEMTPKRALTVGEARYEVSSGSQQSLEFREQVGDFVSR